MVSKYKPRQLALDVLVQIFGQGAYANLALDHALKLHPLESKDRGLATQLVYGVTAKKKLLDWYLAPFLKRQPKLWVRLLLLTILYQILFLDKIPASAALDEGVKIAKKDSQNTGNFVNAVVRHFLRSSHKDQLPKDWETLYSIPGFLIDDMVTQLGGVRTGEILRSLEEPSHISIRKIDPDVSIAGSRPSALSPVGLVVGSGDYVTSQAFQEGKITIQDETSQLVALQMDIQGDEQILDACAAPGGKTTHMAQYLTTGHIVAGDIHAHKLKLIEDNADRLKVRDKISTQILDATQADQIFPSERFDKILVDAPCSGLGLMRRKPDIKYGKKPTDFADLQKLQLEILGSLATSLKKNGIMIYSTCTILDQENFDVVEAFLARHREFVQVPLSHEKANIVRDGCLFITPELYHTDGFFIAKFQKIGGHEMIGRQEVDNV